MNKGKLFLVIRHGDHWPLIGPKPEEVCFDTERLNLVVSVIEKIGQPTSTEVVAGPEWDTQHTGRTMAELFGTELITDKSLSECRRPPPVDKFVLASLANTKLTLVITHYKRMMAIVKAAERKVGHRFAKDHKMIRWTNRALLIDIAARRVTVEIVKPPKGEKA